MTISYNWLSEYLPKKIDPTLLSTILTSIGLEVESMEKFESVKGGLQGLLVGEVISCEKHPEADKLKLTTVNIGQSSLLNIVCGAPNVAVGQKVIVATIGSTIYPTHGEPITMKKAKIRGAESEGMICAEDEIGLGDSHAGITILPSSTIPGTPVKELYNLQEDYIFEIGLTPNRMDAMSHLGVARDVCAYLSYHENSLQKAVLPYSKKADTHSNEKSSIEIIIENDLACSRYCGVLIHDVKVMDSPDWLQQKLKAIGQKPINNIVDITNFILHESGQPLHAFDATAIKGNKVIIKNATEGLSFKTLDEKQRKLSTADLVIANEMEPMCLAGVYGGLHSGVTNQTTSIFLESAFFDGGTIRKTSLRHGLRTDAATRFEKGVDISNTKNVLERAALLIQEIAGGSICGSITDCYANPKKKETVTLSHSFLKKLSGKHYDMNNVATILLSLGFEITQQSNEVIEMLVPFHKSDIHIPADIVEEIMRIDGLDNIDIPSTITIAPSIEKENRKFSLKEKIANYLVGLGFHEIFTNSITNSAFYSEEILQSSVKMMNSLSSELDMLRPEMVQSGLQCLSHNINRKNNDLQFFEIGKTYSKNEAAQYFEKNHLVLYITGNVNKPNWKSPAQKVDFFYTKGVVANLFQIAGIKNYQFSSDTPSQMTLGCTILLNKKNIGVIGELSPSLLKKFDIKQPVFFIDIDFDAVLEQKVKPIQFKELPKFPLVNRDLALVVDKKVSYSQIEQIALANKIEQLKSVQLFDIFESEKLGADKKSMAVSFTFLDETKTMTDKEIDAQMQQIISNFENKLQAEIRK